MCQEVAIPAIHIFKLTHAGKGCAILVIWREETPRLSIAPLEGKS